MPQWADQLPKFTIRVCHVDRSGPTNSPSTNRAHHFNRNGPTLLPTFAPAKVSAHAVEKSLFDRPREPRCSQFKNYYSVTKASQVRPLRGFQTLASFAQFPANVPSYYQQLTDSLCAFLITFCDTNPLFSTSCGLFCANTGVGGIALEKLGGLQELKSVRDGWQRRQERADPIPDDLHANADQQERRQLQDHRHTRRAQHAAQTVGKAITKINACS